MNDLGGKTLTDHITLKLLQMGKKVQTAKWMLGSSQ